MLKNAFNRLFNPNFIKNNQSVGYRNHKELKVKVEIIHLRYLSCCFQFSKYHVSSLLDNQARSNKLKSYWVQYVANVLQWAFAVLKNN